MNSLRSFLIISWLFLSLLLWQAWQRDQQQPAPTAADQSAPASINTAEIAALPTVNNTTPAAAAPASGSATERIRVETDLLSLQINTLGATITALGLKDYPQTLKTPGTPFPLLMDTAELQYHAQGGLLSTDGVPTHRDAYHAAQTAYTMTADQETLNVPLTWENAAGLRVIKTFTFQRGSHVIGVHYQIENRSTQDLRVREYSQLQYHRPETKRSMLVTYTGAAFSSPENRYDKHAFEDFADAPLAQDSKDAWIAVLQHYFVAALIPPADANNHFYTKALGEKQYLAGFYTPEINLPASGAAQLSSRLYAGPKKQAVLEKLAPGLDLTVDYGSLWFIAKPLFWLLEKFYLFTHNWGVAIILLTLLVKLAFYRLSAAGYRSMARMKAVQPRLVALKERYGEDRTKLNQAMMELYKTEKINPLGGCFPILVQIPVFLALYWVLLESVELRQAPFVAWIKDLADQDPYYVLPLLMGATMWFQTKMNPTPPDPVQARVMQIMPIMMTFFFLWFPAGLVLYWCVNNILSIAQQWIITRQIEGQKK